METSEYKNIYENEEAHGWYRGMKFLSLTLLDKYLPKQKQKLNILDAGCGTGSMIGSLAKYGKVYGIDISPEAIKYCRLRGLKNVQQASVMKLPFGDEIFDVVTCFDVLYHQQVQPDLAVKEINRVLKKDGIFLLRVPALEELRGAHDTVVHTARRFSGWQIQHLLEHHEFKILLSSYINYFLFPATYISRKLTNLFPLNKSSDIGRLPWIVNASVEALLKMEAKLITHTISFPLGVSFVALAQKQ